MEALHLLVARSCAGKDFLAQKLVETGNWDLTISGTTRAPRANEVDGVNYHFMTREEFDDGVQSGMFLEHAEFSGRCYGTPASEIERISKSGKLPLAIVEPNGARQIAEWCRVNNRPLTTMTIDAGLDIVTDRFADRFRDEVAKARNNPDKPDGVVDDKLIKTYAERFKASLFEEESWHRGFDWDIRIPVTHTHDECEQLAERLTDVARARTVEVPSRVPRKLDYKKVGQSASARRYGEKIEGILREAATNPAALDNLAAGIKSVQYSFISRLAMHKSTSKGLNV